MSEPIKRTTRSTHLSPEDAAKYRLIREQVAQERPEITNRVRARMSELDELAQIFIELRKVREAKDLSLSDMQNLTGIDRSTLSKLENGQRANFTLDTVLRYADAVGKQVMFALADKPS